MKTINIAGILILWFTVMPTDKQAIDMPQVCIPIVEPGEEVVVDSEEATTDNFSRPRKPCPPSGPGKR